MDKRSEQHDPTPVPASAGAPIHERESCRGGSFSRREGGAPGMDRIMEKLAYFPFYPADFFSDPEVELMSNREIGVYLRLLCHAWKSGGLPTDQRRLARIAHESPDGFADMWPAIEPCWQVDGSRLVNGRMEKERTAATAKYRRQCESIARAREAKSEVNVEAKPEANVGANVVTHNSELITTEQENSSSVPKGTADGDETWNERLAPYARAVGGDAQVGNWLKYWKPIVEKQGCDEAESIMWGLRWLIDKGQLEYMGISKGGTCKPSILRSPRADILKTNALEAYNRHAPNPGQDVVRKLTAI